MQCVPRRDYRKDCQHYSVRWTVLIHQTVGAMACACQHGVVVHTYHEYIPAAVVSDCDCKSKPSGRPREMSRTRQSWVARVRCPAIRLHQFQHGLVYFVRPRDESQCLCPTPPRCFRMRNFCDRPEPADPTATLSIIMYIHMLAVGSDSSSVGLTNNRKAVHTHPPQSRR